MDVDAKTSVNTPVTIELQVKDSDPDSQLTVSIISYPSHGKLKDIDQTAHTVTYIPNPNYVGDDSFTYKVNNGKAESNTAAISVSINPQNGPQTEAQPAELGTSVLPNNSSAGNITSEFRNQLTR